MGDARTAALDALMHVETEEGFSNIVLDKTLKKYALNPRDAALASAIFYGVLERRITLDYIIAQFSKLSIKKMSPKVKEILRMGAYQILYMDKIPQSAAVNESVILAKAGNTSKAAGFINAILRSLIRGKENINFPDSKNSIHSLSIKYSCPEWLIELWNTSYGTDCTELLLQSLLKRPPIFIRVNNTKTDAQYLISILHESGIDLKPVENVPNSILLDHTGNVAELKGFQEGYFHVQDLSSQICCLLINSQPGEKILDICSAPGGKAFTLAEYMENKGELLAFDKYKGKVHLIAQGAERLGLSIIHSSVRDALEQEQNLPLADRVLCDVPCSGLGIIRRKPEIRYKLKTSLDSLPNLQYRILCNSSKFVKQGGMLFYSTCTLNPAENAEVANRFVMEHADFQAASLSLPNGIGHAIEEPDNQLTLMPHIHGTDGFFIASFQKR